MITPEQFTETADGLFQGMCRSIPHERHWRLLQEVSLRPHAYERLKMFVGRYVANCFGTAYIDEDQLISAVASNGSIPNLTPNGLLCPKAEVEQDFNDLQAAIGELTDDLDIAQSSDLVHVPANVRIVRGDQPEDKRAYATSVWHSDAWAGEPLDAVVVHMMVFGDTEHLGIAFGEMQPPLELSNMRIQHDYRSAADAVPLIVRYATPNLRKGCLYLADPRLLHRTKRDSIGIRISIDFRFRLKADAWYRQYADDMMAPERRENYMSWLDFRKLGKETRMVFSETMEEARAKYQTPESSVKHAVNFTLKDA